MAVTAATPGTETPITPTMTLCWVTRRCPYPIHGIVRAPSRPSVASMVVSVLRTVDATTSSTEALLARLETLPKKNNTRTFPVGCTTCPRRWDPSKSFSPSKISTHHISRVSPFLGSRRDQKQMTWASRSTFAGFRRTR
jgi:hypothetical protein